MHNNNEYNRDADISATVLNLFIIAIIMQNIEIILIAVFINYICFYIARERYCEEYCNYKIYYFIKRSKIARSCRGTVYKQEEEQEEEARKIGSGGGSKSVKFNKRTYSALISRNL